MDGDIRHEHVLVAIPVLQAEGRNALATIPKPVVVVNSFVLQVCIRSLSSDVFIDLTFRILNTCLLSSLIDDLFQDTQQYEYLPFYFTLAITVMFY